MLGAYSRPVLSPFSRSFSFSARRLKAEPDLITGTFLKEIRDLTERQKSSGGSLVNSSAEIKKQLEEQLMRLASKFGIPSMDAVSKLEVKFEKPQVESSVAAVTEGRSLDDMIVEMKSGLAGYEKEREIRLKEEAEKEAAIGAKDPDESKPMVFKGQHAHLFNHPVHGRAQIPDQVV